MHQISADEFCIVQRNDPAWITKFPATCGKSHFFVINIQDSAVGNGNLMCISAKILNRVAESVESFLDIRTPVFFVKIITEFRPFIVQPMRYLPAVYEGYLRDNPGKPGYKLNKI